MRITDLSSFKEELGKTNWAEIPGLNDPSCDYEILVEKFISIYDRCFPLRKMKANGFIRLYSSLPSLRNHVTLFPMFSKSQNCFHVN